jgi:hypothetical protein
MLLGIKLVTRPAKLLGGGPSEDMKAHYRHGSRRVSIHVCSIVQALCVDALPHHSGSQVFPLAAHAQPLRRSCCLCSVCGPPCTWSVGSFQSSTQLGLAARWLLSAEERDGWK